MFGVDLDINAVVYLLLIITAVLSGRGTNVANAARDAAVESIRAVHADGQNTRQVVHNGVTERLDEILSRLDALEGKGEQVE